MERSECFDGIALLYDEARPSYPDSMIQRVFMETGLTPRWNVLEIGAGTGKATLPFAERGCRIRCIEPGENLARVLQAKCAGYPNVAIDITRFEKWEPVEDERFDLILCAQAFHWISPEIRYRKCHRLLKSGGYLALIWYTEPDGVSKVQQEINSTIRGFVPGFFDDEPASYMQLIEDRKAEIISSGIFQTVELFGFPWESRVGADEYIRAGNSYSKMAILDEGIRRELNDETRKIINRHGGYVDNRLMFCLYLARRA